MNCLTEELRKLKDEDADIALVIDTFAELQRAYSDTLTAMGVLEEPEFAVRNSADMTISFRPGASSANQ